MSTEPRTRRTPLRLLLAALCVILLPATTAFFATRFGAPWTSFEDRAVNTLPAALSQPAAAALERQRFVVPSLDDLTTTTSANGIVLPTEPVATRILETRPTLRWTVNEPSKQDSTQDTDAVDTETSVEVLLFDAEGKELASTTTQQSFWRVPEDLTPGQRYSWRVVTNDASALAQFELLSVEQERELERRLGDLPEVTNARTDIARAVLYLEYGLLDEARRATAQTQYVDESAKANLLGSLP